MKSGKAVPRIIKIDGFWYVLSKPDVEGFWYSLGIGLTPQQAWEEAFPRPWWRRIWS